jgi:hypothetical protein
MRARLTTIASGDHSVTISWDRYYAGPGGVITGYEYYVTTSGAPAPNDNASSGYGENFTGGASLTSREVTATLNGAPLTNGTPYTFYVRAYDGSNWSIWSEPATDTPGTVPTAPKNLTATSGDGEITLTWDAPESDGGFAIIQYEIAINDKWDAAVSVAPGDALSYTFDDLNNDVTYKFSVRARTSKGVSPAIDVMATPADGSGDDDGSKGDNNDNNDNSGAYVVPTYPYNPTPPAVPPKNTGVDWPDYDPSNPTFPYVPQPLPSASFTDITAISPSSLTGTVTRGYGLTSIGASGWGAWIKFDLTQLSSYSKPAALPIILTFHLTAADLASADLTQADALNWPTSTTEFEHFNAAALFSKTFEPAPMSRDQALIVVAKAAETVADETGGVSIDVYALLTTSSGLANTATVTDTSGQSWLVLYDESPDDGKITVGMTLSLRERESDTSEPTPIPEDPSADKSGSGGGGGGSCEAGAFLTAGAAAAIVRLTNRRRARR